MINSFWTLFKKTIEAFVNDGILSRGAAVAFYTGTSLAPLLLIVTAISGLVFGQDTARDAIAREFGALLGQESADMFQAIGANSHGKMVGGWATALGIITLIVTASGVFGEIQTGLNTIWRVKSDGPPLSRWVKARASSLTLVAVLGFLLLASLVISAALTACGGVIDMYLPFGALFLGFINNLVSFVLMVFLFAAIYKILPDIKLRWHDVWMGAIVTSALFVAGKSLIGLYIGKSLIAANYGAAGALVVVLLWIYYSSQIFFLGAEFTRIYAKDRGSKRSKPKTHAPKHPRPHEG